MGQTAIEAQGQQLSQRPRQMTRNTSTTQQKNRKVALNPGKRLNQQWISKTNEIKGRNIPRPTPTIHAPNGKVTNGQWSKANIS